MVQDGQLVVVVVLVVPAQLPSSGDVHTKGSHGSPTWIVLVCWHEHDAQQFSKYETHTESVGSHNR